MCLLTLTLSAQSLAQSDFSKYPFVNQKADTVSNHAVLAGFFQKLSDLENGATRSKVSIVHMGDSHTQGDFASSLIRTRLQKQFGNAGRGFIFPHSLLKLYGAQDMISGSQNTWVRSAITTSNQSFEPGLAGFSIRSNDSLKMIDLMSIDHDSLCYAFDKVTVVGRNESAASLVLLRDSLRAINSLALLEKSFSQVLGFDTATHQIQIITEGDICFDGFVLENNQAGVLYHVLGVHGAHFVDFAKASLFFEQLALLQPDMILLSLGTNDGVNRRITQVALKQVIEDLVRKLQAANPQAQVVLLTPFDNYYRRGNLNKYLQIVQKSLVEVAQEQNLAYIDAYQITGGFGSVRKWRQYGLLRTDGIHYSKVGYELQAKIIQQAIIHSYKRYANY